MFVKVALRKRPEGGHHLRWRCHPFFILLKSLWRFNNRHLPSYRRLNAAGTPPPTQQYAPRTFLQILSLGWALTDGKHVTVEKACMVKPVRCNFVGYDLLPCDVCNFIFNFYLKRMDLYCIIYFIYQFLSFPLFSLYSDQQIDLSLYFHAPRTSLRRGFFLCPCMHIHLKVTYALCNCIVLVYNSRFCTLFLHC